jgi:osmotically-inducible protein OsmY
MLSPSFLRKAGLALAVASSFSVAPAVFADSSESAPIEAAPAPAAAAVTTAVAAPAVATAAPAGEPAPIAGVEAQVLTGAEVVQDITPFTMTEADREIAAKVIDILAADNKLRGRIAVSVLNGKVMLSGKVKSVPMIYRAVELSRRVVSDGKINTDNLWRG